MEHPSDNISHPSQRTQATSPQTVLASAIAYRNAGRSVIPTIGKKPTLSWKQHQERRATLPELQDWFLDGQLRGLGIVAGVVSGCSLTPGMRAGLEFLDIDDPPSVTTFEDLVDAHGYGQMGFSQ